MRLQISLTRFLLLCAGVAAVIGIVSYPVRRAQQKAALIERIELAGGHVREALRPSIIPMFSVSEIVEIEFLDDEKSLDPVLMRDLARLESLRSLGLHLGPELHPKTIDAIAAIENLEYLSLSHASINDEQIASLRPLTRLCALDLSSCQVTDACLADIGSFNKLEALCVANTEITVDRLARLRLERLTLVDASDCPGEILDLTPQGFGGMASLRGLTLRGSDVGEICFKRDAKFRGLTSLNLRGTNLSIEGLAEVLPSLRELAIESPLMTRGTLLEVSRFESLSTLVLSRDYRVLYLGEVNGELTKMDLNGSTFQVRTDLAEQARATLEQLQSKVGIAILDDAKLRADMYERMRVYPSW